MRSIVLAAVAVIAIACSGSQFTSNDVSAAAGAGETTAAASTAGMASVAHSGGRGGTGASGTANAAGAPTGGSGVGVAGSTTTSAAGTTSIGGTGGASTGGSGGIASGGSAVGGSGGIASAGAGTGGVPACGDVQASDVNCGACGYACVNGRHCSAARCTPAWQPLSTNGAPSPRTRHAAAALGGKYVVLGGTPSGVGVAISSAAAYDPSSDTWSTLPSLNSARCSHEAVSTGAAVLAFGGLSDCSNGATTTPGLESFTPNASGGGSWSTISIAGEPEHRYNFAAAWTGSAMLVYGGGTSTQPAVASGALFTMSAWSDASCTLSGCQRGGAYSMFGDGTSIRVWGGDGFGSAPTGLTYDTVGKVWSNWAVPDNTAAHLAQRFADDGRRIYFLTATDVVSVYDRKTSTWLANDTSVMPSGFCTDAAAAWTGSELVAWSGACVGAPVSVGGRYQPPAPI